MSARTGITGLQVLALAVLASCGGVQASDPADGAAVDSATLEAPGPSMDGAVAPETGRIDSSSVEEAGSTVASCATTPPPLVGVDEEQCATDCHSALCMMAGVRFVGCKRSTTSAGLPAQFYCGADFVTPTCVEACP